MNPASLYQITEEQKERYLVQPDNPESFSRIYHGSFETLQPLDGTLLRFWLNAQRDGYPEHWHSCVEMIMPLENIYTVTVMGKTYRLSPGDILLIPSGALHSIKSPESGYRFIFQFEAEPVEKLLTYSHAKNVLETAFLFSQDQTPGFYECAVKFIHTLSEVYWQNAASRDVRIYGLILDFIADYNDYRQEVDNADDELPKLSVSEEHRRAILQVINYIDDHFYEEITLEQMARMADFSKFYFTRLFKFYTGQTFYHYLNRKRVSAAQTLLSKPDISITDIAFRSGFNSSSSFARAFKSWTSYTPREYRRMFNPSFVMQGK
ncbi:MAG: helix-turn-helix domain-containing protein [Lachnospiraceae bacterium]|nr:helix-turn-helix domain-containing protein [Lachnospiraceae bacterium]